MSKTMEKKIREQNLIDGIFSLKDAEALSIIIQNAEKPVISEEEKEVLAKMAFPLTASGSCIYDDNGDQIACALTDDLDNTLASMLVKAFNERYKAKE